MHLPLCANLRCTISACVTYLVDKSRALIKDSASIKHVSYLMPSHEEPHPRASQDLITVLYMEKPHIKEDIYGSHTCTCNIFLYRVCLGTLFVK
jgi:hypothetical protein